MEVSVIDVSKILAAFYVLLVAGCLDRRHLEPLNHTAVYIVWIIVSLIVLGSCDVVLGVVLAIGCLVTYIKTSVQPVVKVKEAYSTTLQRAREHMSQASTQEADEKPDMCEGPPVPMEGADKALQKYIVDDLLKKAAEDGIIEENMNTFPNSMGATQWNIQGIEKDMVGFNYTF